jgi:SPP1 gp7 family putative phage head morphogenesis protein
MILTQKVKPAYWDDIENQLQNIFYAIIFEPIVDVIEKVSRQMKPAVYEMRLHTLFNDRSYDASKGAETVRLAIRSGKIQYESGVFSGDFNGIIARALRSLGAKFMSREKVYRMDPASVPGWVKADAGAYKSTARAAHDKIRQVITYIDSSLEQMVEKHTVKPRKTITAFEKDFQPIAQEIQVHPNLSQDSIDRLSADYTENMKLWIQKFSAQEIEELRGAVEENAQQGYRFDRLIEKIENRYGVARSKAKFLARQETALFMSKFRQDRFREGGVTQYTWSTAHDERVRSDHKHLNGRVFSYSQPPVVDLSTGRRANPGEDFNCRCVDIPILRPIAKAA